MTKYELSMQVAKVLRRYQLVNKASPLKVQDFKIVDNKVVLTLNSMSTTQVSDIDLLIPPFVNIISTVNVQDNDIKVYKPFYQNQNSYNSINISTDSLIDEITGVTILTKALQVGNMTTIHGNLFSHIIVQNELIIPSCTTHIGARAFTIAPGCTVDISRASNLKPDVQFLCLLSQVYSDETLKINGNGLPETQIICNKEQHRLLKASKSFTLKQYLKESQQPLPL